MRKCTDSLVKPVLFLGCILLCPARGSAQNPALDVSQRSATAESAPETDVTRLSPTSRIRRLEPAWRGQKRPFRPKVFTTELPPFRWQQR